MKIIYIAHPISGDVEGNLKDIRRIVRRINLEYPDVVPMVPYYVDCVSLDDSVLKERERGIKNDTEIISRKIPDEMWLTGNRISSGMQHEKELAEKLGIIVVDKTEEFK